MAKKALDSNERANNKIKEFADKINTELKNNPQKAKEYKFKNLCEDFSKYLEREHIYASSSMKNILNRNGLMWQKSKRKIITMQEFCDSETDDYEILDRIYHTFIQISNNQNKKTLKTWLEESFPDDILTIISVSKGLLIVSDKKYFKKNLRDYLKSNNSLK